MNLVQRSKLKVILRQAQDNAEQGRSIKVAVNSSKLNFEF